MPLPLQGMSRVAEKHGAGRLLNRIVTAGVEGGARVLVGEPGPCHTCYHTANLHQPPLFCCAACLGAWGAAVRRPGLGTYTRAREHAGAGPPLYLRSTSLSRDLSRLQPYWSSPGWQTWRKGPERPTPAAADGPRGPAHHLRLPLPISMSRELPWGQV